MLPNALVLVERTQMCNASRIIARSSIYFFVSSVEMTVAIAAFSLALSSVFVKKHVFKSFNVQIILCCALSFMLMQLFSVILTRLYYEISHFIVSDNPCYYVVNGWFALIARFPHTASYIGLPLVHVALCVERVIASCQLHSYERSGSVYGWLLIALVYLVTMLWMTIIFVGSHAYTARFYVVGDTLENTHCIIFMIKIMCVVDTLATIFNALLLYVNQKQIQRKTTNYGLSKSFQLRENQNFNEIFLPTFTLHSACSIVYLAASIIHRIYASGWPIVTRMVTYECIVTFSCVNSLMTIALFLHLHGKLAAMDRSVTRFGAGEEAKIHWNQFNKQINE